MISVSAEQIERVNQLLHHIPQGAEKAFSTAINKGINKARTTTVQGIRRVYTVDSPTARGQIITKRASSGGLVGSITYSGSPIPLDRFDISPTYQSGHRQRVTARVLKASGKKSLGPAFVRKGKVKARIGPKRYPLERKYSVSLAQMAEKTEVYEPSAEAAQEVVSEELERAVERLILGG